MLLFQYIICYALCNFCFTLLKNLTLRIFMRQLILTAVFGSCSTNSLTLQPIRRLSVEGSGNLRDQLAERSPAKKFSDDVVFLPELKALLAHPWRSRKEQLHPCSHSKATAGLDQGACSCTEKQISAAWGVAVHFFRQLIHLLGKL